MKLTLRKKVWCKIFLSSVCHVLQYIFFLFQGNHLKNKVVSYEYMNQHQAVLLYSEAWILYFVSVWNILVYF